MEHAWVCYIYLVRILIGDRRDGPECLSRLGSFETRFSIFDPVVEWTIKMHPVRRRKLSIIMLVLAILGLAFGLVLYALRQNISLFYTPTQIINREAPKNRAIRVGGMVVKGSILRNANGLNVVFKLTDYAKTITIHYHGILPDLFREEQGVVAQGLLQNDLSLNASQVLAKHDENYMPPEVKSSLQPKMLEKLKS